ncbi:MAG: hypothetical protein JSU63_08365, partial [Phycisphaerales bacterium]
MQATKTFVFVVACVLPWGHTGVLAESVGTAFTFQGQLKVDGVPADGNYDFVFKLFDAADGNVQIGAEVPIDDWLVSNGLFTVELNGSGEFGSDAFNGDARWLQVAVRHAGNEDPHTVLTPRVALNPTPYATYALNSADGGLWAA